MLELGQERSLMDVLWGELDARVCLSVVQEQQLLALKGPTPNHCVDDRRCRRFFERGKAVLVRRPLLLGVDTKDISRRGISFMSPVRHNCWLNLFTMQRFPT
jgi:hypothetical protein